jgi:hypothetical protein
MESANPEPCMCAFRVRGNRIPGMADCVAWTLGWLGPRPDMSDYLSLQENLEEWESGAFQSALLIISIAKSHWLYCLNWELCKILLLSEEQSDPVSLPLLDQDAC